MKNNTDIRELAKSKRVFLYEIAEFMGIQESFLSKKLRHELTDEDKERMTLAIKNISERRG